MCSLKPVNQNVCFGHDYLDTSVTIALRLQGPLNRGHFSQLGVRVTFHITTQSGSSVLHLKWPPSPNKDASLLKAPHSTMNLVPSLPPSHHNLSCQLPRFVFGSDPSPSVQQSHFMFTSAPEAFLPAHYSCFLLSAKWIPIKSTVLQLEFGGIYLVQSPKSHCLTSFSHVAASLESVTEKMRLVISCNRILLGSFVFSPCLLNMLIVQLVKCAQETLLWCKLGRGRWSLLV